MITQAQKATLGDGLLAGRVALVTGAAGGLGTSIVKVLENAGATVVGTDLAGNTDIHADIGTREGNVAAVDETVDRHGRLDIIVCNAGLQFMSPLHTFPDAKWDLLNNVMVKGPLWMMQAAWPHLIASHAGRIVVTASTSSLVGESFKAGYTAAKHAVLGLVRVAALEGAAHGITANAVGPGWMHTPLVEQQLQAQMELHNLDRETIITKMSNDQPAHRFVETEEVANVIAFLASPLASAVNGTLLPVDHGDLAG